MNKFFLILAAIIVTFKLSADIKYDPSLQRFYTIPQSSSINQDEYHALLIQTTIISIQCWNNGVYGKPLRQQITSYLKTLNTPTSLRVLADLEKDWN